MLPRKRKYTFWHRLKIFAELCLSAAGCCCVLCVLLTKPKFERK